MRAPRAFKAAVGAGLTLAVAAAFGSWTVDDAWIVARYATRLAAGRGWTFQDGPPTDGVTAPLWAIVGAAVAAAGLPVVPTLKALGAVGAAVAVGAVAWRLGGRALGGRAAAWSVALAAGQAPLAVAATSGLSGGAAAALCTALALGATRRPPGPGWFAGLAAAALPWLRPELVPFAAVCLAILRHRDRRAGTRAIGLAAAGLAGVALFRVALFGHLLPLAVDAKPGGLVWGLRYAVVGAALVTGVGGAALVVAAARRGRPGDRGLAAALGVHLAAVALAGGDWMPAYRLLAPVIPVFGLVAGVGAALLTAGVRAPARGPFSAPARARGTVRGGRRVLVAGTLAAAIAGPWAVAVATVPRALEASAAVHGTAAPLADELARRASRVALVDVGYLAWRSGVDVVDLGGLVDPEVARLPGGHLDKRLPRGWLAARAPDAIVLHSRSPPRIDADGVVRGLAGHPVENRVARDPWVRSRFHAVRVRRYAPTYHYVLLVPRDVHQDPGGARR